MIVQWRARHCDKPDHRRGGPAHLRGPWGGNGVAVFSDRFFCGGGAVMVSGDTAIGVIFNQRGWIETSYQYQCVDGTTGTEPQPS